MHISCYFLQAVQKLDRYTISMQDIQVYRFYRDLISFQGLGDPSMMLRCINPREVRSMYVKKIYYLYLPIG